MGVISTVCGLHALSWLFCIQYFSYIKLSMNIVKFIPQIWKNFRRKSTVGWSIGLTFLEMVGGVFNFLQMLFESINAGNFNVFKGVYTLLPFISRDFCLNSLPKKKVILLKWDSPSSP